MMQQRRLVIAAIERAEQILTDRDEFHDNAGNVDGVLGATSV